jgi:4-amino-4-deoxy-L-arabinose transferase-like glycosyltransferase
MQAQIITNRLFSKTHLFWLLLIIFIGIFLRLYNLGKQSLWLDEAYSVTMAGDLNKLWFEQIMDSNPPLYYSLLHFWIHICGKTEFAIRLLSLIFGIFLIPLIFFVGDSIFDKNTGIYAALLVAISPIHIYYSQEARMYSIMPFLSLFSFFLLYLGIIKRRNIYWIAYAITTIFCLYTHNYGIFLLVSEIWFFIFYRTKKKDIMLEFMLSQICILIAYLPRLPVLFKQIAMNMNPWISLPNLHSLSSTFLHFSILSWRLPLTGPLLLILKVVVPLFAGIFLIGILVSLKRNIFLLAYIVIPLSLAFIISLKVPIYVPGRYDILVFPAFCLVIAAGLKGFKNKFLTALLLIIIILSTSVILYHYYFIFKKSNDRSVSEYIQMNMGKEDVLVATELSITPFEYYWRKEFQPTLFQFPDGPRSFITEKALKGESSYINLEIRKLTFKVCPLINKNNRLWLMYHPIALVDRLIERLKEDFKNTEVIKFVPGDNLNQIHRVYIFKRR